MINVRCSQCKHYIGGNVCDAFDETIPPEIVMADNDHTEPVKGDHGIRFEPVESEEVES